MVSTNSALQQPWQSHHHPRTVRVSDLIESSSPTQNFNTKTRTHLEAPWGADRPNPRALYDQTHKAQPDETLGPVILLQWGSSKQDSGMRVHVGLRVYGFRCFPPVRPIQRPPQPPKPFSQLPENLTTRSRLHIGAEVQLVEVLLRDRHPNSFNPSLLRVSGPASGYKGFI